MRDKSRHVLSIVFSTTAHVVVLLTGLIDFSPDALDLDLELEFELVEVDLVELDKVQGEEEKPPEPVQPPPTLPPETPLPPDPTAEKEQPKPEDKPEPTEPKHDLGQKKSTVDQLGPPNSTFHVLLSTRNIRKLPYAKLGMSTIAALPDYEFLVGGGGFDALRDFDHILIASPDLRSVTQTFLAVDYKVPRETMKTRIEKACAVDDQEIEWIDENGVLRGNPKPTQGKDWDPRWFVLGQDNIALYMRAEFLPAVLQPEEAAGEAKTTANFIAKLSNLKKFARRIPTAGLQFEAHDLHAALKRTNTSKFELPDDLELTIEAQVDPEISMRLEFKSIVAAKQFMSWWDNDIRELVEGNFTVKMMVGSLLDAVEVTQEGKEVRLWAELERDQTELILKTISGEVEKFQEGAAKKRAAQMKAAADKAANEPSEQPNAPEAKQDAPKAGEE